MVLKDWRWIAASLAGAAMVFSGATAVQADAIDDVSAMLAGMDPDPDPPMNNVNAVVFEDDGQVVKYKPQYWGYLGSLVTYGRGQWFANDTRYDPSDYKKLVERLRRTRAADGSERYLRTIKLGRGIAVGVL